MKKGFEKAGGKCCPTSSGSRTVYTGGPARKLQSSMYGKTPNTTVTPDANKHAGTRKAHLIGQR